MPSQHRHPARTFRPERGEYADAQAELAARGQEMDAFLRACLRWLHRDPDRFLATLTPVWPGPRPRGRPAGPQPPPHPLPAAHKHEPVGSEPAAPGADHAGAPGA